MCAQGKNGLGGEGENGNIMLLLDAAQELHRSSSGDEGNDIEPSTAGTGVGELTQICLLRCSRRCVCILTAPTLPYRRACASAVRPFGNPALNLRTSCSGAPVHGSFCSATSFATAGSQAVKDDARSRKAGLRQAPPKSRKLQEPDAGDNLLNPPRYSGRSSCLSVWHPTAESVHDVAERA